MSRLAPRFRLVLWAPGIAAALVATLLSALLLPGLVRRSAGDSLAASLEVLAPLVVARDEVPLFELQTWVREVAGEAGVRLTVIRGEGQVLAESARDHEGLAAMDDHSGRPEVVEALARGMGRSVRTSATTGRTYVYAARALPGPGEEVWVVRLGRPLTELDELYTRLAILLLLAALGGALAAVAVGLWFRRQVLLPFEGLIGASSRLAGGTPGYRVPVPEGRELGILARSLNLLAERVEEQIGAKERERRQLDEILAGMAEGVLVTGADARPLFANGAFRRLLGLDPGTPTVELLGVLRSPRVHAQVESTLRGERGDEIKLTVAGREVALRASPIEALGGALLVARDVTEAERVARMRRDFVANLSHELKNPLAVIRGAAETLQDAGAGDTRLVDRFTTSIVEQCYRLEDLLKDLLTLSRLESPEAAAQRKAVDLAAVAGRAVELGAPLAERQGVGLVAEIQPVPLLDGDAPALERLVLNLLDNGIKYNRPGGRLTLRLWAAEETVSLEVEDQGGGIPAAEIPRIFERFYRVDKGRGRGEGGSGLGLAIVKHVAQSHGGGVEVESRLGEGTLFRVTLPVSPAELV